MKQVVQDLRKDSPELVTAPVPQVTPGHLLVDTTVSLISAGTERMLIDFARANLVEKARQQPEKVRQVLEKVRTDGLATTVEAVRSKMGQPIPLGYCNVGRVRVVGPGVNGFRPGDRVVSNGPHADVVRVPKNLAARIPDDVSDDEAAFAVLGAIGLQGVRLAQPTLGEFFVVTGVGLIGLLTVQLLRAQGCRVLAIDVDARRLELARELGASTCNVASGEDPIAAGMAFSRGQGVDGVIITASTRSSDPVAQAARMSRKRGRIILVGVTGLELNRSDFYEKELTFQVSCSYGPGRYDSAYEEGGQDYPLGYVRWTEQRNFEAILGLLQTGQLVTAPLVTHRFPMSEAARAYETFAGSKDALGVLLEYPHPFEERHAATVALEPSRAGATVDRPGIGFIGAGNYASRVLIPAFQAGGARLVTIASSGGTSSALQGRRAGFRTATSDTDAVLSDPEIDAIVIATRHDSHARLTATALQAGKHVFVEKPLALTAGEIDEIEAAHAAAGRCLMIGFNRRFAPLVRTMKSLLDSVSEPKTFMTVMNAGAIPPESWVHDVAVGGGRIIGEACHHIDLLRYLAGSSIVSVQARRIGDSGSTAVTEDKAAIVLGFADGSFGTIHYLANGPASFPKERVEVFAAGRALLLDNFLKLRSFGWPGFRGERKWRQDKGQTACVAAFLDRLGGELPTPIPPAEVFEVSRAAIEAAELLRAQA